MNDNHLLDALTFRGVLISVSVRYWRARRRLRPEDLGLDPEKVDEQLYSLGHKKLLPKRALESLALVESRAHSLVEVNSFPFLGGVARYLPNTRLREVTESLERLRDEFNSCREDFLARYGQLRDEALTEWREAARRLSDDPERVMGFIEEAFPELYTVQSRFGFDIRTFQITAPEAAPRAELIEMGTRQEVIEAREEAVQNARREIDSSCREFIADCAATLREQTARLCGEMLETINTTGNVHQKTLNRLIGFIDRFRELNFVNDAEMERQLEATRESFLTRTAGEYRDSESARRELVRGLGGLRERAMTMAGEDASAIVEQFGRMCRRRFDLVA